MAILLILTVLNFKGLVAALSCGDPGLIYNGTTVGRTNFNSGGIIRYKCKKCYERKGPSMLFCSKWGHWSGEVPKCLSKECPPLVLNSNKILSGKRYGFEYQFKCKLPKVLIGRSTTRCTCSGRWSSKPPICRLPIRTQPPPTRPSIQEGYCPQPERLHNGIIQPLRFGTDGRFQIGDRVYFLCNIRYRLIGPNYRECGWNGKWDNEHPYCQIEYCSKLFPPINGEMMGTNLVGSFMEFQCEAGYTIVGANKTLCLRNGQWSERTPKCKPACNLHRCPSNRHCVLEPITQQPICECNLKNRCSSHIKPLCADDGQTYKNECQMKLSACTKNKIIQALHDGPCKPRPSCHTQPIKHCKKKLKKRLYRYNSETGECEKTYQATCHSSGFNGYQTEQECQKNCKNVCTMIKDKGPCKNGKPTLGWFYVPRIKTCRRFIYYGCYGNANNFATGQQCFTFCTNNHVKKKKKSLD